MSVRLLVIANGHCQGTIADTTFLVHGELDFSQLDGNCYQFSALFDAGDSGLKAHIDAYAQVLDLLLEWMNTENQAVRNTLGIHPDTPILREDIQLKAIVRPNGMKLNVHGIPRNFVDRLATPIPDPQL